MSKEDKILDLVVKGEWFDKIKSGEKTHEFRERNRYWDQRLGLDVYCHEVKDSTDPLERASARQSMRYKAVRFRRGYAEDAERMLFGIKSISIVDGLQTDLHIHDDVFDIELGERVEPKFSYGQEVFAVFFKKEWQVKPVTILSHKTRGDSFSYVCATADSLWELFPEDQLFQAEQEAVAEAKNRTKSRKICRFKERNLL